MISLIKQMHLVRKEILVIAAIAKSKVIQKIINRASDNVVRCVEIMGRSTN